MRDCKLVLVATALFAVALLPPCVRAQGSPPPRKKVVLIAGPKSHGPVGNGIHDYPWSVKLLKVMLDNSSIRDRVQVEYHLDGFPADPATLDDADTVMVISDGRDGDKYEEAPHFKTQDAINAVQKQIDRGCGFLTFHFSTFAPDQYAQQICEWSGGYFDWETDGERKWYSAIQTAESDVLPAGEDHPVLNGIGAFKMREEFYFNLRFAPEGQPLTGLTPLWSVPELPGRDADGRIVAWAKQRTDGGRGFGTTCGHFYDNWRHDEFRRLILNAIAWTAKLDVPPQGVSARWYSHAEITSALAASEAAQAVIGDGPIRALLITGNDAHKWHNWEKSTPAVKTALERDPRITVDVQSGFEGLAQRDLSQYQLIVQNNYANWHDPRQLSDEAKVAFVNFLQRGGGLLLIHFANGAFHYSLPEAGDSDWPEYRKIVRRMWNHHGTGEARSGHDAFGRFAVNVTELEHPVTAGLQSFDVTDELYFRQDGDVVEPLLTARSKVTDRDEPLAFTYQYGEGRVFQTFLGHSEKTYETFEAREILRRAAAWVSGRHVVKLSAQDDPVAPAPQGQAATAGRPDSDAGPPVVDGRFGKALNARRGGILIPAHDELRNSPLTVELWTKLNSSDGFNILVASEPKSSKTHWELYTYRSSGNLSVYIPGRGGEYRSECNIADGEWHLVSMVMEPGRLRLFVDQKQVLDRPISGEHVPSASGQIAIGRLAEGGIGCDGLIDEVWFRKSVHLPEDSPDAVRSPPEPDDDTTGLFHLNDVGDGGTAVDSSERKAAGVFVTTAAPVASQPQPGRDSGRGPEQTKAEATRQIDKDNHWGRHAVGFDWTEKDSVDDRWQQSDIGNWLSCLVALPEGHGRKTICIRAGRAADATVCFDTAMCQMRAAWNGGFLRFNPARYGIISPAQPVGEMLFANPERPGWNDGRNIHYQGMYPHGDDTLLSYDVDGCRVLELPRVEMVNGQPVVMRTLELSAGPEMTLHLLNLPTRSAMASADAANIVTGRIGDDERPLHVIARSTVPLKVVIGNEGTDRRTLSVRIPARDAALVVQTSVWPDNPTIHTAVIAHCHTRELPESLDSFCRPSEPRWIERIVTQGELAEDVAPYVVDTITVPFDNPYRALMFVSGHDFLSTGEIALCTVHGDVWVVSGINAGLEELRWKRFATGLFQPLGLVVKRAVGGPDSPSNGSPKTDEIHVLGRDQITRLHDRNSDGEADFYECFNNEYQTSPGGHDYVTCLETDSNGDFWLTHAVQGVVRISSDGKQIKTVATGLRNPNGLGVGPGDIVTAAPQEGEWTPASAIFEIHQDSHFGYRGPQVTDQRPRGFDPPLCWIPRRIDNSSGGQVWAVSDRWGPLSGAMLHLSYGQCRMSLVLRDEPDDGSAAQGGLVELPLAFDSGVMRGRFSPHDGQLYVSGLKGWVSSAVNDGCLQRVRYTGQPVHLPVRMEAHSNGLAIEFSSALDRETAESTENVHIEQWQYHYSSAYGSDEYRPSRPDTVGRDEVSVRSVTLLNDHTMFIEIPDIQPVDQMAVSWSVRSADGVPVRDTLFVTLNSVSRDPVPEESLNRRSAGSGPMPDEVSPGLVLRFKQGATTDARVSRLAALSVDADSVPTPFMNSASFSAEWNGWLRVPLAHDVRFTIESNGQSDLLVNDHVIIDSNNAVSIATPDPSLRSGEATLRSGMNRITIRSRFPRGAEPDSRGAILRLFWDSDEFAREPVPPSVLWHSPHDADLIARQQLRRGRELFATLHCGKCHGYPVGTDTGQSGVPDSVSADLGSDSGMYELSLTAPRLRRGDSGLSSAWISRWLLSRGGDSDDYGMPNLMGHHSGLNGRELEAIEQDAADLAAWLGTSEHPHWFDTAGLTDTGNDVRQRRAVGEALFEDLGCIACHVLDITNDTDTAALLTSSGIRARRSLAGVVAKRGVSGVRDLLLERRIEHDGRLMPDFSLTPQDATRLTAYIFNRTRPVASVVTSRRGDSTRGRKLFAERGCRNCHQVLDGDVPVSQWHEGGRHDVAIFDPDSADGCLSPQRNVKPGVPQYVLPVADLAALRVFVGTDMTSLKYSVATEAAQRLVETLRCDACHDRDTDRSPRARLVALESERGLPPESLPTLTWAGEKLHEDWMAQYIDSHSRPRVRPWLKARMPAFPAAGQIIARGFREQHGIDQRERSASQQDAQPAPELTEIGRQLTETNGGLDCRQCHAIGNLQPRGDDRTQIAPGINFAIVRQRLRKEYYHRLVLDPPRLDPSSKMPRLAADGRTTHVRAVFDGDAARQFNAIWHYIQTVDPTTEPEQ